VQDYEKLAAFYLGREVDDEGALHPAPLLYDAKDLTTHGVIVGMTGSGKTGLVRRPAWRRRRSTACPPSSSTRRVTSGTSA
jgi:uncharacterized Zn-binding protein involved in type VI secretion